MKTMKRFALFTALFFLLTGTGFAADQTIAATEEMVGSGHATKSDTLNRLTLVEHNTDGTHKAAITGLAVTAGKTITATQDTSLDEAVAMSSKAPKASPSFTGLVTTAGQIAFPATANPSADANTLDDYEEGTWTPTLSNFTVTGALTVTGYYTKVGRFVFFSGTASAATSIVWGASAIIDGLPFVGVAVTGMYSFAVEGTLGIKINAAANVGISAGDWANQRMFIQNFDGTGANIRIFFAGFYIVA